MFSPMNHQLTLWDPLPDLLSPDSSLHQSNISTDEELINLPGAIVIFCPRFLSREAGDRLFHQLLQETAWRQEAVRIFDKSIPQPRLTAWYGDPHTAYTYSGIKLHPEPWTPTLLDLKSQIELQTQAEFNSVLLNLYRDGQDSVSWHSDNEPELRRNPIIASLSLGATRRFSLKHRQRKDLKPVHLELSHGSLLLMLGDTQKNWLHQVPKTNQLVEKRISLTFRVTSLSIV